MDYRALEWISEQWRVHLRRGDLCIQAGARTSSAASASKAIAVCSLFTAGAAPMDGAQAAMVSSTGHPVSLFEQTAKLQRRGPRLRARVPTSASFASGCCNEGTVAEAIAETVDIIRLLCNAQK